MNTVSSWQSALIASWNQVWTAFLMVLPTLFGAVVIFALGLIVAFWLRRLITEFLKLVRLDKLSKSAGVDAYLSKAGIKMNLVELGGKIGEWLIIFIFFLAAVDVLGLTVVSRVLTQVLNYIPNIVAAVLILGAGYFVAGLVESLVRGALASVDHDVAKPLAKVARWVVLVVVFFAAIEQMQIARGLITTFFQGLTYTVVLVVGLSFGLGAKDLISKILTDWYEKVSKK